MTAWKSVVGADDTVLNGGEIALVGSLDESDQARFRKAPGAGSSWSGTTTSTEGPACWTPLDRVSRPESWRFDSDPPMVLTHLPMPTLLPGWVNLYGHVHNNVPLLDTRHNACVEHTDYRPLPLESLLTLGKRLLAGRAPEGATTADRISEAVGSELSSGA